MSENKAFKERLIKYSDFADDVFAGFKSDKERIKYMSTSAYKDMNLAKSFSIFYGIEVSNESKKNTAVNKIVNVELGKVYNGTVKEFNKQYITFTLNGVKEEIICRENFNGCEEHIQNYLLTHDNKLLFEVREKKNDVYHVSVIQAYYKVWTDMVNKAIQNEDGIEVHIDKVVRGNVGGGYLCHTEISSLNQLTGRNYTHSVFIPGSHIVLNIERNFDKWIDQDVVIVPQKFVEYYTNKFTGETEMSLVGSRKRVLQIYGMQNMYEIYQRHMEAKKNENSEVETFDGTVTGIINSSNKTGIFVELDNKYITGLAPVDPSDLLEYRPGDSVKVRIKDFEVQEGKEPFIINKKNKLIKCNVRPVFELA